MQHNITKQWRILVLAVVLNFFTLSSAFAFGLNISLSGFTVSQAAIVTQAENYWESVITGYQPGITGMSDISISASTYSGSLGGVLGSAGPTCVTSSGGYTLTTDGFMEFDSVDLAFMSDTELFDVVTHELAHIIGFGTLWELNGLYVDGSGQYTGAAGLAAYQAEFNPGAAFIPVELGGSSGTANGHWDEAGGGNDSANPMNPNELMTGWLDSPAFVSLTTKASFIDLGYTIAAIPLPAAIWLFLSGLLGLIGWSRRKQTA